MTHTIGTESTVPAQPSPLVARIGRRIRAHRRDLGLTVQELGDRASVSRRLLTQIEHGQGNPSLVTIDRVALGLGLDFATLTAPDGHEDDVLAVGSADDATLIWSSPRGSTAQLLISSRRNGGPELWHWHLEAGDGYDALPDPSGSEELFTVITGTLTIAVLEGPEVHVEAGGFARLRSDRRYRYENRGTEAGTRFIRVVELGSV